MAAQKGQSTKRECPHCGQMAGPQSKKHFAYCENNPVVVEKDVMCTTVTVKGQAPRRYLNGPYGTLIFTTIWD